MRQVKILFGQGAFAVRCEREGDFVPANIDVGMVISRFGRLRNAIDGGYAGQLIEWVKQSCGWILEIVKRNEKTRGFEVLPKRWIVERTFGWFGWYRRLSKD